VAGFIGVSNLIEREGHTITVRPEKLTLTEEGEPEPSGAHTEPGQVRDVIYAGVLTRYVVHLDAGGELVVSRQNAEARASIAAGSRVRVTWRPDQAFTIPQGPDQGSRSGEGNQ
jgi:ABC-type Fe3+/spermidine/putrescine transport system ATPase subunit